MSRGAGTHAPLPLVLAAGVVVALLLLPLAYLVVRVAERRPGARHPRRGDDLAPRLEHAAARGRRRHELGRGRRTARVARDTDRPPGRRAWATAAALPLVIPSYVAAFCLLGFFGERGLLADALDTERLPEVRGYWGSLVALTLATYPYVFLLAQSALRTLDPALEEAARGLGSSGRSTFLRVTLPALRPAVGLGALLVVLYTLSDFGVVSLMNYDTAHARDLRPVQEPLRPRPRCHARAPARGAQRRRARRRVPAAATRAPLSVRTGNEAPPQPLVRLGRWRAPALAFCSVVVGLFLVLPTAVLGYWLSRGIANERALGVPWAEALHSLVASALAAGAAVLAALPVAILALRYPSRAGRVLERLSYAGNALPGLVIALSLVFFAARYASPVYQTLALLVFAYVVRFFPQGLSGVESALETVSPRHDEAARSLGLGPLRSIALVTVPLVRPGILAGAALVFLSAMKELPATLLLRPIGFDTLATEIWRLTQVGAYSRAAVPALVLIVVSAPVLYLVSSERRFESGASG